MMSFTVFVVLLVVTWFGVTVEGLSEAVAASCGPPLSAGLYSGSLVVGGQNRTYYYRIAANYHPCDAQQLLIGLHGTCGNATCGTQIDLKYVSQMYAMAPYSQRAISIYPNARLCQPSWANCPQGQYGWDLLPAGDDAMFIAALESWAQETFNVDASRMFAYGFSRGGFEAEVVHVAQPGTLRAIYAVAGALPGTSPLPSVPAAHASRGCDNDNAVPISWMVSTREAWRTVNGCASTGSPFGGDASCVSYDLCALPVVWCERSTCSPPHTWTFPQDTQDVCAFFAQY